VLFALTVPVSEGCSVTECMPLCPPAPPGCHFEGALAAEQCEDAKCGVLVCDMVDGGVADSSDDTDSDASTEGDSNDEIDGDKDGDRQGVATSPVETDLRSVVSPGSNCDG
jgi:hypothetical protein